MKLQVINQCGVKAIQLTKKFNVLFGAWYSQSGTYKFCSVTLFGKEFVLRAK